MINTNNVKVIAALAAAVLAGTALGLIFAPEKGEDTRNRLANGARDIAGNLKKKLKNEVGEVIS